MANEAYFPGIPETDKVKDTQYIIINNEKTGKPDKTRLDKFLTNLGIVTTNTLSGLLPETFIEVTYAQAQTLVNACGLEPGTHYKLTNKADGGIMLLATTTCSFSLEGQGIFLNPDFQGVGDYSGTSSVTSLPYGATQGVWVSTSEPYAKNDVVFWGGMHYQVISASALDFVGTNPSANIDAYKLLPKRVITGYIEEVDFILYDFDNDFIIKRHDRRFNSINGDSLFQWGNDACVGNTMSNYSIINNINQRGVFEGNQTLGSVRVLMDNTHTGGIQRTIFSGSKNITVNLVGVTLQDCYVEPIENIVFPVSTSYSDKRLDASGSTFNADLDSVIDYNTPLTTLTIPSNLNYVGIFTIIGALGGSITKIVNPCSHRIRIYSDLTRTGSFVHTAVAGAITNQLISDAAATNIITGDYRDFIEYEKTTITGGVIVNRRYNAVIAD